MAAAMGGLGGQRNAPVAVARGEGSDRWRSDMSVSPGWVSVRDAASYVKLAPDVITRALADVDKWMRSQPSAREAICRG